MAVVGVRRDEILRRKTLNLQYPQSKQWSVKINRVCKCSNRGSDPQRSQSSQLQIRRLNLIWMHEVVTTIITTFMSGILYVRTHVTTLFFCLVVANESNVYVLLATPEGFYSSSKTDYMPCTQDTEGNCLYPDRSNFLWDVEAAFFTRPWDEIIVFDLWVKVQTCRINKWPTSLGISRSHNLLCFLVNQGTREGSEITLLSQAEDDIQRNHNWSSANQTLSLTFFYIRTIAKTLESPQF